MTPTLQMYILHNLILKHTKKLPNQIPHTLQKYIIHNFF